MISIKSSVSPNTHTQKTLKMETAVRRVAHNLWKHFISCILFVFATWSCQHTVRLLRPALNILFGWFLMNFVDFGFPFFGNRTRTTFRKINWASNSIVVSFDLSKIVGEKMKILFLLFDCKQRCGKKQMNSANFPNVSIAVGYPRAHSYQQIQMNK